MSLKSGIVIVLNSLVYFLLAYFFVITLSNLFSIFLAKASGFDAVLYYYGYELVESTSKWSDNKIILIFGIGMGLSFCMGIFFERWYKAIRRDYIKAKVFLFWAAVLSFTWFLGSFVIGAFFNFGIGAAMRAGSLPFIFRILLAIAALGGLIWIGYHIQSHIVLQTVLYYRQFNRKKLNSFIIFQIIFPAFLGIFIITIFKYPYSSQYLYLDIATLLFIFLIVAGTLIKRLRLPSLGKMRKANSFKLNYRSALFLIFFMIVYRISLKGGLSF